MLEIVTVSPQQLLKRILTLEILRIRSERRFPPRACEAAATRVPPTRLPSMPCGANSVTGTVRIIRGAAPPA